MGSQPICIRTLVQGLYVAVRVDGLKRGLGRSNFWQAYACSGVGNLPLQVGQIHHIVVYEREVPNTRTGQVQRCGTAQAPNTYYQHAAG